MVSTIAVVSLLAIGVISSMAIHSGMDRMLFSTITLSSISALSLSFLTLSFLQREFKKDYAISAFLTACLIVPVALSLFQIISLTAASWTLIGSILAGIFGPTTVDEISKCFSKKSNS